MSQNCHYVWLCAIRVVPFSDRKIAEGSLEVKFPTSRGVREEKEQEDAGVAGARKGRKAAKHCAFPWFVAPEGRKVGSLKRRVRSHLARWEMKSCMPLWREAHLEVKMYKTHHSRTTFGSWDVEKVHTAVVRSTFGSQDVQSTSCSDDFWKLRCRKSAHSCGPKHVWKSTCTKHSSSGALLEVGMSKKCAPLWCEAHVEVKSAKTWRVRSTFGHSDVVPRSRRKGLCTLSKVSQTWGFCSSVKNVGRRGPFEEDLQRCISRGRRSTRDMFIRDVRRSGRWFPEKRCIWGHQIFRFAKIILRDRCSTSYDLASLFRGTRSTLETWSGKNAKRIGTRKSATFNFWRNLAELLCFWCCHLLKLRKSRRITSFLMLSLSPSKIEEDSQNCFVFDVVKLRHWGNLAE